jgi:hypothetical protein
MGSTSYYRQERRELAARVRAREAEEKRVALWAALDRIQALYHELNLLEAEIDALSTMRPNAAAARGLFLKRLERQTTRRRSP